MQDLYLDKYKKLVTKLRTYAKNNGFTKTVIGVSGGIDSALTLKIAVDAFGAESVTALLMPESGVSSAENLLHAKQWSGYLGVQIIVQPINTFVGAFSVVAWNTNKLAAANNRARVRMVLLYNYANSTGSLVLGTSNKSEVMLGYGTKYGDFAADVEVIGDLWKTEVWEMARAIGMPALLIEKTPSAELYEGQTDEGELGVNYKMADQILQLLPATQEELVARGLDPMAVHNILSRVRLNEHKRKTPHILKLTNITSVRKPRIRKTKTVETPQPWQTPPYQPTATIQDPSYVQPIYAQPNQPQAYLQERPTPSPLSSQVPAGYETAYAKRQRLIEERKQREAEVDGFVSPLEPIRKQRAHGASADGPVSPLFSSW